VRYEIHLAGDRMPPPKEAYFDSAWQRAIADGFVDGSDRDRYRFQLRETPDQHSPRYPF